MWRKIGKNVESDISSLRVDSDSQLPTPQAVA